MPITSMVSDATALTLTVVADYGVPVERLWNAYADPRQLERFWGPTDWPATFTRHDMVAGGRSAYHLTGPDGTIMRAWFDFLAVEPHKRIDIEDGFADENGEPDSSMPPMHTVISFGATADGSRFTSVTKFASVEAMAQMVEMGVLEGMKSAMGQIDALLADLTSFAIDHVAAAQLLSDTQIRVSRVVRGTVDQVWRAHTDASLMQRWMLGPDGWTMPVCNVATEVGDSYRYEWEAGDKSQRFGFEGELLESAAPYRAVTTERMIGMEGPGTRNELTLVPVQGGTLLSIVITYPSKELRDMILGTGMTTGMEASYVRMEREVLAG